MNDLSPFTLKLARVGIAGTLALILATSPLANMGVAAAEAVPTPVSTKIPITQKDSLEQSPFNTRSRLG